MRRITVTLTEEQVRYLESLGNNRSVVLRRIIDGDMEGSRARSVLEQLEELLAGHRVRVEERPAVPDVLAGFGL